MSQMGRHDQAIDYYKQAMAVEPENKRLKIDYAYSLVSAGRSEEALAIYEKLKNQFPDDFKIYEDIGITLASKGKYDEALKNFKKAVELNPAPVTYLNYAVMLEQVGRLEEAVRYLKLYLETTAEGNTQRKQDAEKALVQWERRLKQ